MLWILLIFVSLVLLAYADMEKALARQDWERAMDDDRDRRPR